MSADNGIYILVSPVMKNSNFAGRYEYRVIECTAIDNIIEDSRRFEYAGVSYPIWLIYEAYMFGQSPVFATKPDAMEYASELEDKVAEEGRPLEYGIRTIRQNHPFPELSFDRAKELINAYYKTF